MTEAKREVWIVEWNNGPREPLRRSGPYWSKEEADKTRDDYNSFNAACAAESVRYVPESTPPAEAWVPFDADNDERCPISGNPVQFVTCNGATVGHRNDDGSWCDSLNIGADGTPNDDYTDEQVTHWAPLLVAPPKPPEPR